MASNLRVDSIVPTTSGNVSIGTATGGVTIPGNLGIAGVLTYEDVTNVDSVGVITARAGIHIDDSIVHIGDTNTKIRFPAADTISMETAGNEVLSMNLDGLVTGGQTNPTSSDNGNIYIKNASSIGGVGHAVNYVSNAVFNGAWKYINSGTGATRIVVNQNGFKFDTAGSGTAGNNITFVERFNVKSDGDVTLNNGNLIIGTAGKGIDFSAQTASSLSGVSVSSELLDHYEEGTFTPTFGASNGTSTAGYSTQSGKYTRIGNIVHVQIRITLSSLSTSSHAHAHINGLPIASAERTATSSIVCGGMQTSGYNSFPISGRTESGGTRIELFVGSNGGVTDFSTSIVNSTAYFIVQCTYRAN